MKFRITVKQGLNVLAGLTGREVDEKQVTLADVAKVIEVESFLERLTGFRVHIEQVK